MNGCMCFHVCDTHYMSVALSGLTSCLWPEAVRPEPATVCVCSAGAQCLGTGSLRSGDPGAHNELLCAEEL